MQWRGPPPVQRDDDAVHLKCLHEIRAAADRMCAANGHTCGPLADPVGGDGRKQDSLNAAVNHGQACAEALGTSQLPCLRDGRS